MNQERLKRIALFSDLDEQALRELAMTAKETSVVAGETIVRCGDFPYELAVIDEGVARVELDDSDVLRLGPGELFGELGVLGRNTRTATIVAETDCRLIALSTWTCDG